MIAPARQVAFSILKQVAATDAHSDELLRTPEVDALSPQDRNLTTMLVLGTLRWQLALDERIRGLLARPDVQLGVEAATALRLGAFQLLHLDRVPAHAVINDSVELLKQTQERNAAGMVNAVLRKLAVLPRDPVPNKLNTAKEIAAAFAHPAWMVGRWARRYGVAAAEAICRWDQEPAGVTLRIDSAEADTAGIEWESGAFLTQARRVVRSGPSLPVHLRMQDEASQLVAEIAAAAAPQADRVLDTCAAPGGKAAILAERLPNAAITAVDVSRKRLDAMRAQPGLMSANLQFEVSDAARLELRPDYGLILCDVPCSGTGTMGRNPEIRWRVAEASLTRQQQRQGMILRAALSGLAPHGRLVYSTCSLEKEENEAVIASVLRDVPGFRLVSVPAILDRLAESGVVTAEGRERLRTATDGEFLRTIPGIHPCDGFFAAVLEPA
jgi:16S rRNA (cytosine967-C5)-methyltransferase